MNVDVVIPTYQNREELTRCLDALDGQLSAGDRALVCVDGSTDGTLEELRERRSPFAVEVLEHPDRANHGRSAARNLALAHLRAPVVLLLDSDMVLHPSGVRGHLALLEARTCVSVGDVRYANARDNDWARYLETRGRSGAATGSVITPLHLNSQNTALRSEDLLAVCGFDERLVGYGGEDTELGLRLAAERSVAIVFNSRACATTVETKTTAEGLAQLDRYARTNLRAIRARHPSRPAPYWLDRLESRRPRDRALRALMNPLSDAIARVAARIGPWPLRRAAINYLVLRTVWRGYVEGPR